jgi:hypothetical protein
MSRASYQLCTYVQAYTVPDIFFALLTAGRLSLAECYARTTPFLSWQMVLIGDPLYRPWGNDGEGGMQSP